MPAGVPAGPKEGDSNATLSPPMPSAAMTTSSGVPTLHGKIVELTRAWCQRKYGKDW
jgi:hypothetical protein